MPCRLTCSGRRCSTSANLFCTSIWALSMSVPVLKVMVIVATIGVAGRRHIKQALYAIQLLLDYLSDILLQRRSFRPGICRTDRAGGGRNRWILLNRKGLKRQYPGQNDAKRHDPGKNRQIGRAQV